MPRATAAPTLDQLSPMLLVERKTIPRQDGWLYEIKYDGYRVLASTGSGAQLKSRGGIDATRWFPEVAAALTGEGLATRMLLQVHDELVFEVAAGERDQVEALVRREMAAAADLAVPLDVSIGIGASWHEAGH